MQTHLVDLEDDAQLARAYDIMVASANLDRPWNAPPSLAESVVDWRHLDKAEPMELWAATDDDGLVVAVASVWFPQEDNTWLSYFSLRVDPAQLRRGAGHALVDRLLDRARAHDRSTLVTETLVPAGDDDHPHRRFLTANGFTLASTEVIRHLDLPVADDVLGGLAEAARRRYEPAYRLETHQNGVPDAMRESLCAVMNVLQVDAPSGAIEFEPEALTPVRYQEYLDVEREQRRTRLTTVAVEQVSGDVVAYTDLIVPDGAPTMVWQWGTLVLQAHRGHRLGMAIKAENLGHLQSGFADRTIVRTGNGDTNRWMVGINERLGFSTVELAAVYQRQIAGPDERGARSATLVT